MNASRAAIAEELIDSALAGDLREDSGVYPVLSGMIVDVGIGELGPTTLEDGPEPIYARPYVVFGKDRVRFTRDYYLGTRFPTGIIPAEHWEDEMRADGLPRMLVEKCRRYLEGRAI